MKWIALTGGPGVGKTTLAGELVRLGYLKINFTDLLKDLAVDALGTCLDITKTGLLADKERYRPFLIAFGTAIGFDSLPDYIDDALEGWEMLGRPPAVFDNCRFDFQADYLRERGFVVVRLVSVQGATCEPGIEGVTEPWMSYTREVWRPEELAEHLRDL